MNIILKRSLQVLTVSLIGIQFFRPTKNISEGNQPKDISSLYPIPDSVHQILKTSCYDCHSNNTQYPWYSNIQPVAWWLADHVKEGKAELNFSEFANYRIGRQYRKLEEVIEEVKEDKMPLSSYTIAHSDAKLNDNQKRMLSAWAASVRDTIEARFPTDSLKRPQKPATPAK